MSTPFNPDWLNPGAAVEVSTDTIAAYHSEVLRLRAALAEPQEDEWELRADGKRVRKDRWQVGIRRIVALLWGKRREFEVEEVVEAVRALVPNLYADGDDDALVSAVLDATLAAPVQAPVAWLLQSELDDLLKCNHRRLGADSPRIWAPFDISSPSPDMGLVAVYTAPPQRKPLSEEEIDAATSRERDALLDHIYEYGTAAEGVLERIRKLARAIERAHGIGGQDEP